MTDEEKKALEILQKFLEDFDFDCQECGFSQQDEGKALKILFNLIEKQSKEIKEYKKQLDLDYIDKHFVPIERYNQLEKEIEELKKKIIEY